MADYRFLPYFLKDIPLHILKKVFGDSIRHPFAYPIEIKILFHILHVIVFMYFIIFSLAM